MPSDREKRLEEALAEARGYVAMADGLVPTTDIDATLAKIDAALTEETSDELVDTEVRGDDAVEAFKRVFLSGHSEGWTGNQLRRDVQHVDAERGWNLYVENGALNKALASRLAPMKPEATRSDEALLLEALKLARPYVDHAVQVTLRAMEKGAPGARIMFEDDCKVRDKIDAALNPPEAE